MLCKFMQQLLFSLLMVGDLFGVNLKILGEGGGMCFQSQLSIDSQILFQL